MAQKRPRKFPEEMKSVSDWTDDPNKPLSTKQKLYVDLVTNKGIAKRTAAKLAGYGDDVVSSGTDRANIEKAANVAHALAKSRSQNEASVMMTKKKVMEGFLESIEMAKLKGDPFVMIAGWREVAKMCGYYEPIKHKIEIDSRGQIIVQRLQTLSDAQLVQLAQGNTGDIIDGEIINDNNGQESPALPGTGETGAGET